MKKILVLNFFPAFTPPSSGGELRYFHLYDKLSRHFDITLLSPTYAHHKQEVVQHSATFREYRIPKEPIHDQLHRALDRETISSEVSALVCALSARVPNNFHRTYFKLYPDADIIIHEFPYMLEYDLFFGLDQKLRIYNSHNLESVLIEQVWRGPHAGKYLEHIRFLERKLVTQCDLCFAVSEDERSTFIERYGPKPEKIALAPNGINPGDYPAKRSYDTSGKRPSVLFFGSFHPPNQLAAEFIIDELADRCPALDFVIAGNCVDSPKQPTKANVRILGKVSDAVKRALLATADIAINPMFSGAGTNLKVLEYLASGLPLVTTATGARGLKLAPGEHFVGAGKEDFATKLMELAEDRELQEHIGQQGRRLVARLFSWQTIADQVAGRINDACVSNSESRRKTLLVLNDFEVDTPSGGGEVRINRLYSQMSEGYRIVLLCLNSRGAVSGIDITKSFRQISLPKTKEHLTEERKKGVWGWVTVNDIVTSLQVARNELVREVARVLYELSDAVILSHPYMVRVLAGLDGKPVIHESLNCEYELKQTLLQGHPDRQKLLETVRTCEIEAIAKSTFIVSVSDHDHPGLRRLSKGRKAIHTLPNGVDLENGVLANEELAPIKAMFQGRPVILFIGSGHKPNIDSVAFIRDRLAPALPDCCFLIIGSVCDMFVSRVPSNMLLCGKVDEDCKQVLVRLADVAINPMLGGSGSNLKLAEYLAHRIPVVTTPFGARGYSITPGKEAVVCELEDFQGQIRSLLGCPELRQSLAEHGHRYVRQELDWKVLAQRYDALLQEEIFRPVKKRLLVVTYRFTDPPLGGAEVHLLELLRQMAKAGDFKVDVATLDIVTISNQFHFSSQYTFDEDFALPPDLSAVRVFRCKTDVLPDAVRLRNARTLFQRWMAESREASLRHLGKYTFPLLLGGWYYPEVQEERCELWASEEALLYVPQAETLMVRGFHPKKTRLRCIADQELLFDGKVKGEFEIKLSPGDHPVVKFVASKPMQAGNDPRTLGVRIRSLHLARGGKLLPLPLNYDYKAFLKAKFLDEYINELIHTAQSRPAEYDELFQTTRGPLSRELTEWLEEHTPEYDLVLGHSIPFATSILAARAAKKHGKPLILIPDFHIDDEFYHWRSYYDALRQAADMITFPRVASRLFFDKLGCTSSYLPCGIHLGEEPAAADLQAFKQLYPSELPYVLVLGRKERGKNYQQVLDAVKQVNARQHLCNVVLIGRDEDGMAIHPDEACYLGGQPGNIVRAALSQALCLITMSTSESFGIVILEAWAQRRPVVVNEACVAYTELVDNGVNGLLASQENLHTRILHLLDNPATADQMGANGYLKTQSQFTWEVIAGKLEQMLAARL